MGNMLLFVSVIKQLQKLVSLCEIFNKGFVFQRQFNTCYLLDTETFSFLQNKSFLILKIFFK